MAADGLIWWSTPDATCGLVVRDAVVVDCPPYAAKWAAGRDARQLWREAVGRGMHPVTDPAEVKPRSKAGYLMWVPDAQDVAETRMPLDEFTSVSRTMVRRWQSGVEGGYTQRFVCLGWLPDGRWWVELVRQTHCQPWIYTGHDQRQVRAAAEAKCAELMAGGGWAPTIATYQPGVHPPKPADVPEWPAGLEPG